MDHKVSINELSYSVELKCLRDELKDDSIITRSINFLSCIIVHDYIDCPGYKSMAQIKNLEALWY